MNRKAANLTQMNEKKLFWKSCSKVNGSNYNDSKSDYGVINQTELRDHFNIELAFFEEDSFQGIVKLGSEVVNRRETSVPDLWANNIYGAVQRHMSGC